MDSRPSPLLVRSRLSAPICLMPWSVARRLGRGSPRPFEGPEVIPNGLVHRPLYPEQENESIDILRLSLSALQLDPEMKEAYENLRKLEGEAVAK